MRTKSVTNKFGHRLRSLREKQGWTPAQLADRLRVNLATLYRWEGNECRPRLDVMPKLAHALGVTLDDLIG